MTKTSILRLVAGLVVGLVVSGIGAALSVAAQGDDCASGFVAEIERLEGMCSGLQPGMLCAGGPGVRLEARETGALSPISEMASLAGSEALSLISEDGGSSLAVVQLPALEAERSLTGVLWGAVRLLDAPAPPRGPACNARSLGSINVRSEPSTQSTILGQLAPDQLVPIVARLADSTWWRIEWAGDFAWVFAELTPADCDPETMLVYDPLTGVVTGGLPTPAFQAARLETGVAVPACAALPPSGALVQSPAGGASWLLNGMLFQLEGTLWVQAPLYDVMVVQVLEGRVIVEAGPVSRIAETGELLRIPLRDGQVDGVPGPALTGLSAGLEYLPVALLPRSIELSAATLARPDPQAAALACSVLPQHVVLSPDDVGGAEIDLVLDVAQTVRVSAAGPGVSGLEVAGQTAAPGEAGATVLMLPALSLEAGTHTLLVRSGASAPVTLGVTCDLPVITAADIALSCEELLLHWEAVQGGSVQFSAPAVARASVLVMHDLPSEGPAEELAVLSPAGEVIAQSGFAAVGGVQVAGPLSVSVPETGLYRIEWDGDPFNSASIEVVCELVPPDAPSEE